MGMAYVGWTVAEADRLRLLARFPPAYPQVVAHHVTLAYGVAPDRPPPPPAAGRVVGVSDDGAGVQTLVVAVDGTTARPDGSTFHVTWSLAPGRRSVESNAVIARHGWRPVDPVALALEPYRAP